MTAEAGHNSGLSEEERKALFFSYVRKRLAIDAKIKELRKDRKEEGAEAQSYGLVLADLDFAIKALSAEDKSKISERYLSHGEILGWLGLVSGFQADLFRDRAPQLERIENNGLIAGLAATAETSGYAPKSEEDTIWKKGYRAGQKMMAEKLQSAMEKKNAEAKQTAEALKGTKKKPGVLKLVPNE